MNVFLSEEPSATDITHIILSTTKPIFILQLKWQSIAALKIKYSVWYWDATNTKTNEADTAKING